MFRPLFATALLLLTLFWSSYTLAASGGKEERLLSEHFVRAKVTQPKPLLNFQDGNGRRLSLRDFKGRYVLLNLWATWCAPCVREMPALDALQAHLASRKVTLIALSEDRGGAAAVKSFYDHRELKNMKVFVDTEGVAPSLLGLRGMPTTLLIDPEGKEIGRVENALDWMKPENLDYLDELTEN